MMLFKLLMLSSLSASCLGIKCHYELIKAGECPANPVAPQGLNCDKSECKGDQDCKDDLKCCKVPGGIKACVKPAAVEKQGTCPKNDIISICTVEPKNRCTTDEDCQGDLKCCEVGCNKECVQPEAAVDVCKLGPIEEGKSNDCKAYITMYTYNREKNSCCKFIYGGCNAGKNLFETKEKCEKTCVKGRRSCRRKSKKCHCCRCKN